MKVWVIQYSKSKVDGVCDSSIEGIYDDEQYALNELIKLRDSDSGHNYYLDEYLVISKQQDRVLEK